MKKGKDRSPKSDPVLEKFLPKLCDQVCAQLRDLIEAEIEEVYETYRHGLAEMFTADPEAKLGSYSLRLGFSVVLKPGPDADMLVGSTLGYGVRRKVEHAQARLGLHEQLPGMED